MNFHSRIHENFKPLYFWPDNKQETEENKHRAVGNIYHVNKGVAPTHNWPYPVSVDYAGHPENDADHQPEEHKYYAGDYEDHLLMSISECVFIIVNLSYCSSQFLEQVVQSVIFNLVACV